MSDNAFLVVGVDPSARKIAIVATHPVLMTIHAESYILYKTTEKQTMASLGCAVTAMQRFLASVDGLLTSPRYAWVEDPLIGRGGALTTMKQSYVQGIIRGMLVHAGFTVYGVNVSTWKKDIVGNGHAEKSDVLRAVKVRWPKIEGLVGSDGDLADAAAINLYGQAILDRAGGPGGIETLVQKVRQPRTSRPAYRAVP